MNFPSQLSITQILVLASLMISTNSSAQGLKWSPQQSKAEHFAKHPADCLHSEEDFAEEVKTFERTRLMQMMANAPIRYQSQVTNSPNPMAAFNNFVLAMNSGGDVIAPVRDPYHFVSAISAPPFPKVVTLTFDDGPHPALTPTTLDILARFKIKATFFVVGRRVADNKDILDRAIREGHLVASHSYTHSDFHKLTAVNQLKEVDTTDAALKTYYGKGIKLFRYPYGNGSTVSRDHVRLRLGYSGVVGWHVDSCDWAFAKTGTVTYTQKVICGVKDENISNFSGHVLANTDKRGGGILLFHDVHQRTIQYLDIMIEELIKRGYKFANLDDPRMQQFFK